MQELLNSPQPAPQPGPPVPGTTGGLPALSGLSVMKNPMAEQLQSMGRGEDSMLVHMTPAEVNSLQGLAMASGGSLTINPQTGLPEAGWLGKLLPTLLGGIASALIPGVAPWMVGLAGAAGGTAATGSLSQGLMMGLQAFGGASLAGGLGIGEAGKKAVEAAAAGSGGAGGVAADASKIVMTRTPEQIAQATQGVLGQAAQQAPGVLSKTPGFFDKFGAFAKTDMPGVLSKAAPYLAGAGLLSGVSEATAPNLPKYKGEDKFKYTPMAPGKREVRFQTPEQMRDTGGAEFAYFTPSNPEPVPVSALPLYEQDQYRFAEGGLAAIPPQGFNELVDYFGATNPGAITASMYYPASTPPAATEKNYFPTPSAANPAGPGAPPAGGYDGTLYGIGGINYGGIDLSGIDWSAISQNLGINNIQQQLQQQQQMLEPTFNTIRGIEPEIPRGPLAQSPDLSGIYDRFGALESKLESLPAQQPVYQAPDLSGIYDRFGALESKLQSLPTQQPVYQTPDLSGIYDRFGALESRLEAMPTYQAPDLSGLYDRLNQIESRFDYVPPNNFAGMEYIGDFAKGGAVNMRDGSFVVDARTVSELGNGSSNAGIEMLSRMGGKPVRGPGDGVSDSVKAKIGGTQEARVARDEVIFPPEAVRRIGGGSDKRGTQKLYALMEKAHKARKKAARGQDTGVRKGLA